MAKQGKFISGSLGRVVFYELNGVSIMRSKPVRVRQTRATKASAKEFGRMSGYSKLIREYWGLLGRFSQRDLMLRLNSALLRWNKDSGGDQQLMSRNLRDLRSFELNPDCLLARHCMMSPKMDLDQPGKVLITVPAFKPDDVIKSPRGTYMIKFTWLIVRCNTQPVLERKFPRDGYGIAHSEISTNSAKVPEQRIEMPLNLLPGDLILLALRLTYYTGSVKYSREVTEKKWMPAGVLAAEYREI